MNIQLKALKENGSKIHTEFVKDTSTKLGDFALIFTDNNTIKERGEENLKVSSKMSANNSLICQSFVNKVDDITNYTRGFKEVLTNAIKNNIYSHFDIITIDGFTGEFKTLKNSMISTYIKTGKQILKINTNFDNIDFVTFRDCKYQLKDDDVIIVVSDGVEYSTNNCDMFVKRVVENLKSDIPEKLSNKLLEEAMKNYGGIPNEEMTAIVIKVRKK